MFSKRWNVHKLVNFVHDLPTLFPLDIRTHERNARSWARGYSGNYDVTVSNRVNLVDPIDTIRTDTDSDADADRDRIVGKFLHDAFIELRTTGYI